MWTVVTASAVTVPVDGGKATASVSDTRKLGSLDVVKTVDWKGITTGYLQDLRDLHQGAILPARHRSWRLQERRLRWRHALLVNLIPGDYAVSETDPGNIWIVTITDSPASVPVDGGKDTAYVDNTLKPGSLKVTKVINWFNVNPDPTNTFEICIKGPSYPLGTETGACHLVQRRQPGLHLDQLDPGELPYLRV